MKESPVKDEFLRKRAERQRKLRKRRLISTFIVLVVLLLITGVILSLTVFFPIKNLSVTGSKIYEDEQLKKNCGIKIGDNMFTVSASAVVENLKANYPYVESIEIVRELPDTMKIKVKDAYEFSCYNVGEKYYTISQNNWVLEEKFEQHDTVFTVFGADVKCEIGKKVEFENKDQYELVETIRKACESSNIELNEIIISNDVLLELKVAKRFKVNLGNENFLEEKIRHLSGMLESMSEDEMGSINLSIWSEEKPQGTFKPEDIE